MSIVRFGRLELSGGRRVFVGLGPEGAHVWSGAPWDGGAPTGEIVPGVDAEARGAGRRLAPVTPSKILCVGRNYREHAAELKNPPPAEPMLFFKPPSAIIGPDEAIELPPRELSERVDHEAELAVVIGRRVRRASLEEARAAIFGVTLAGDITARDLQKKDGQWARAKGMDTFCPVGPVVVRDLDPSDLPIGCRVNGERRQAGHSRDMIFSVPEVLAYASRVMTLEPGDLVLTGTPAGVGPLADGDRIELESAPIGIMPLRVVARP